MTGALREHSEKVRLQQESSMKRVGGVFQHAISRSGARPAEGAAAVVSSLTRFQQQATFNQIKIQGSDQIKGQQEEWK